MCEKYLSSITGDMRESVRTLINHKPEWVVGIIVFGSSVGFGKTHRYSDIDLLLLTKEVGQEDLETSNKDIGRMLVTVEEPVDLVYLDIKEYVRQVRSDETRDWIVEETYNKGVIVNLDENWRDYIE